MAVMVMRPRVERCGRGWFGSVRRKRIRRRRRAGSRQFFYQQHVDLAGIGAQHFETQAFIVEHVAFVRHAAQMLGHQAADGVDVVVGQGGVQLFVELFDLGQRLDAPARAVGLP
jgi:hypothetical protein